jgi:hypothetical protein
LDPSFPHAHSFLPFHFGIVVRITIDRISKMVAEVYTVDANFETFRFDRESVPPLGAGSSDILWIGGECGAGHLQP